MSVDRAFYDDGTLRAEGAFVNGIPDGLHRHWHSNGVLATEVYYKMGVMDGLVKQWNRDGALLGTCPFNDGTGIFRTWYENGVPESELPYLNGKLNGCQVAHFDDGTTAAKVYWLNNEKVSKKRYLQSCKVEQSEGQNSTKPARREQEKCATQKIAESAASLDDSSSESLEKHVRGPTVREARSWLRECQKHSLGEAISRTDSLQLLDELYECGAVNVFVREIVDEGEGYENTGMLIVEMPSRSNARREIVQLLRKFCSEFGCESSTDAGQRFLMLSLD